jgi:hypothetical protein
MQYMAIDQFGNTYHALDHPRKDLMERLNRRAASKMYVDVDGKPVHIGYVIGRHWCTVYEVRRINS